ncbi:uncharacterized protein LAJ45_02899 [Morchella importuna]|uniref:uncharacterized protein n=1 Tax=Morchella importuna TaxID=1174673 RepID=UPI001E8D1CA3|nr:uncharacterized protein LAJ45_02899 [Morchella importuna]KAH8153312.1 hypothetical protein LAJ45_02899 [Morchella importuna]
MTLRGGTGAGGVSAWSICSSGVSPAAAAAAAAAVRRSFLRSFRAARSSAVSTVSAVVAAAAAVRSAFRRFFSLRDLSLSLSLLSSKMGATSTSTQNATLRSLPPSSSVILHRSRVGSRLRTTRSLAKTPARALRPGVESLRSVLMRKPGGGGLPGGEVVVAVGSEAEVEEALEENLLEMLLSQEPRREGVGGGARRRWCA